MNFVLWATTLVLLYAWKAHDVAGAGNILTAWGLFCFLVSLVMLLLIAADQVKPPTKPLPGPVSTFVRYLCMAVLLLVLIWYGHWVVFSMFFFSWICAFAYTGAQKTAAAKVAA
jgi:hypothetical protein